MINKIAKQEENLELTSLLKNSGIKQNEPKTKRKVNKTINGMSTNVEVYSEKNPNNSNSYSGIFGY